MAPDPELHLPTRIVFGPGTIAQLGALVREVPATRAFLVTDPGLVRAGHVERAEKILAAAGVEVRRFDDVRENPTTADVDACLAALGDFDADVLIGFGGGSSIDVAKGCAFLQAGGGRMEDYWGKGKAQGTLLPLIAVPTTAGTGTETQSFALIAQDGTHQKMACGDPQATPRAALLDPELTVTQSPFVTASTGLDALVHAVETAVTTAGTPGSDLFSTESFRLIVDAFPRVLADPGDVVARGDMLVAAAYAGVAIENSMLGAAHALANPLTAHHGVAHGQAVAMMLPVVVRYNAEDVGARATYARRARQASLCPEEWEDGPAVDALVARLEAFLDLAGFPRSLVACGIPKEALPALAEEAAMQWTASFNPRPVDASALARLYDLVSVPAGEV